MLLLKHCNMYTQMNEWLQRNKVASSSTCTCRNKECSILTSFAIQHGNCLVWYVIEGRANINVFPISSSKKTMVELYCHLNWSFWRFSLTSSPTNQQYQIQCISKYGAWIAWGMAITANNSSTTFLSAPWICHKAQPQPFDLMQIFVIRHRQGRRKKGITTGAAASMSSDLSAFSQHLILINSDESENVDCAHAFISLSVSGHFAKIPFKSLASEVWNCNYVFHLNPTIILTKAWHANQNEQFYDKHIHGIQVGKWNDGRRKF